MAILPTNNVVLEEEIDDKFEPSEEELMEYVRWLGMSLPEDQDLVWIAREGLKAPLPAYWKPWTDDDEIYYFNFMSGDSVWEHPCDEYYRCVQQEFHLEFI
ncbi:hypothetical protein KC19_VG104200 [Ceratodon purpureus]|uniref:WW domain-containing protein n=1 Tax=Ceratodon purpureus TaxID=3225 RepID=A0A8T0HNV3_CERPU|nr:hypothetical protein KC19_VG104200 [Ceratodon purpureus]